MSLKNILDPEAKKEEWTKLYCNELSVEKFDAGNGDLVRPFTGEQLVYSLNAATNGILASTTATSLYITGPFYNYVGQIRVNGVGRGLPPNNEIQIDVQLPFNMVYPSIGADIDGSVSGAVFELTDNSLLAIVNCRMVRLNVNTLRIYVYFDRDINVVVNTRELIVGYNITVNGPQP